MRCFCIKNQVVLLVLLSVLGCSKPETKLVGTWTNEKTSSSMEFRSDKTGVIHQRTHTNIPPDIEFKWTMLDGDQFKVEVNMPGAATAQEARGKLEAKDTMVLDNDTFKKTK